MRRRTYLAATIGAASPAVLPLAVANRHDQFADPTSFEGESQTVTDPVDLEVGATVATATHDGVSNFIVEVISTEDGLPHLLVNAISGFDGASGTVVEQGRYVLDVDADGAWTIDLFQPRASEDEAESLPIDLEGDSGTWAGPFAFEGLALARGMYEGQSNFIVDVLPQAGGFPAPVFNEIDAFEGETTVDVTGVGYITVEADGPWTLSLEDS